MEQLTSKFSLSLQVFPSREGLGVGLFGQCNVNNKDSKNYIY